MIISSKLLYLGIFGRKLRRCLVQERLLICRIVHPGIPANIPRCHMLGIGAQREYNWIALSCTLLILASSNELKLTRRIAADYSEVKDGNWAWGTPYLARMYLSNWNGFLLYYLHIQLTLPRTPVSTSIQPNISSGICRPSQYGLCDKVIMPRTASMLFLF
ncbi:hypothetical protein Pelo_15521 [Pelomyxa schiedti]|nr:hypothetical protein Pelo_15521 [Pelomyxa schiedti]